MKYYEIYEDRTTYLLGIDHQEKIFKLGSFKGKPQKHNKNFKIVDSTGYLAEISKITASYILKDNNLQYNYSYF